MAVGWAALKILLDAPRIFLCGGTAVGCDGRGPGGRRGWSGATRDRDATLRRRQRPEGVGTGRAERVPRSRRDAQGIA